MNIVKNAGDDIEAQCTRCRMLLNHTIVAIVGSRIVRVKCNTCGGEHAYHPPKEARVTQVKTATTRTSTSSAASRKKEAQPEHNWEAEMVTHVNKTPKVYNMNAAFGPDDVVDHPSFGKGIVKRVTKPNKMDVLFRDGIKLLRCSV